MFRVSWKSDARTTSRWRPGEMPARRDDEPLSPPAEHDGGAVDRRVERGRIDAGPRVPCEHDEVSTALAEDAKRRRAAVVGPEAVTEASRLAGRRAVEDDVEAGRRQDDVPAARTGSPRSDTYGLWLMGSAVLCQPVLVSGRDDPRLDARARSLRDHDDAEVRDGLRDPYAQDELRPGEEGLDAAPRGSSGYR